MSCKKINLNLNQFIASSLFLGNKNSNSLSNHFILGKRRGNNVIDLNYTYFFLKKFVNILTGLLSKKNSIWIVNENFTIFNNISKLLKIKSFFGIFYYNHKWVKGMLSNSRYVKKIKKTSRFPQAVFTVNLDNNFFCVNECYSLGIPSFGICDTNDDPSNMLLPIPGNSKSLKSIYFYYLIIAKSSFFSKSYLSSSFFFQLKKKANLFFKSKYFTGVYFDYFFNYSDVLKKSRFKKRLVFLKYCFFINMAELISFKKKLRYMNRCLLQKSVNKQAYKEKTIRLNALNIYFIYYFFSKFLKKSINKLFKSFNNNFLYKNIVKITY